MNISANLASLEPLSPKDFLLETPQPSIPDITKPLDVFSSDETDIDRPLDIADKINLQTALNLLRDARTRLRADAVDKKLAGLDLVQILGYLVGYFDGMGLLKPLPPHAGFSSFGYGTLNLTIEDQLDQLDSALGTLLADSDTRRNTTKVVLNAVGDLLIGVSASLSAGVIAAYLAPTP